TTCRHSRPRTRHCRPPTPPSRASYRLWRPASSHSSWPKRSWPAPSATVGPRPSMILKATVRRNGRRPAKNPPPTWTATEPRWTP
ncbi:hypothetical protein IWQ60_005514, partial [Tieghemiomyces parasiticus]